MTLLGFDLGISSTKVVLVREGTPTDHEIWEGDFTEQKLLDYLHRKGLQPALVDGAGITGVGSLSVPPTMAGISMTPINEFQANTCAAPENAENRPFIVVSMGSGTSFCLVSHGQCIHLGGSALGGGLLDSLRLLVMPQSTFSTFIALASEGDPMALDSTIGDVCGYQLPDLPLWASAVNMGHLKEGSSQANLAASLLNMILQNIGVMAYLAGSGRSVSDYVVIGRLATLPHVHRIFGDLSRLYGIRFHIPTHPDFVTATGAAMCSLNP